MLFGSRSFALFFKSWGYAPARNYTLFYMCNFWWLCFIPPNNFYGFTPLRHNTPHGKKTLNKVDLGFAWRRCGGVRKMFMGCRLIGVFLFFLLPSASIRVTQIPVRLMLKLKANLKKSSINSSKKNTSRKKFGRIYIAEPLALGKFCKIFVPNIDEGQKKSYHLSAGHLALCHEVNPALLLHLRS